MFQDRESLFAHLHLCHHYHHSFRKLFQVRKYVLNDLYKWTTGIKRIFQHCAHCKSISSRCKLSGAHSAYTYIYTQKPKKRKMPALIDICQVSVEQMSARFRVQPLVPLPLSQKKPQAWHQSNNKKLVICADKLSSLMFLQIVCRLC